MPNLTTIGSNVFHGTSIKRVENIGDAVLSTTWCYNAVKVEYINFGKSHILGGCSYCTALKEIVYDPELITTLYGMMGLASMTWTDIDLPNCTAAYVGFNGQYINGGTLQTIMLPKLTTTSGNVFYGCGKLKNLLLGPLEVVSGSYFMVGLDAFVLLAETPPNYTATNLIVYGYIYVLDSAVEAYKTATNWSAFASKIVGLSQLPTLNPEFYAKCAKYVDSYINK